MNLIVSHYEVEKCNKGHNTGTSEFQLI